MFYRYIQSQANTQVVGAEIAILVDSYISKNLITSDQVHVIGHSLGAQAAGYAGQRVRSKLGRITGLDPAGPYFLNTKPEVRLDPTDAKFVDVIHSDKPDVLYIGLGIGQAAGHVDFYPNGIKHMVYKKYVSTNTIFFYFKGGNRQPNCAPPPDRLVDSIFSNKPYEPNASDNDNDSVLSCSHLAAVHYYIGSHFCPVFYLIIIFISYRLDRKSKL